MRARGIAVAIAAAIVAGETAGAQSPAVTRGDAGQVTVHAQGTPLGQLLRELAALTPMDLRIDPAVEGVSVTTEVVDVPIERAIYAVLQESGVNIVVAGLYRQTDDVRIRVVAGNPREAAAVLTNLVDATEQTAAKEMEAVSISTPPLPDDDTLAAAKAQEKLVADAAADERPATAPGAMTSEGWMQSIFLNGGLGASRGGATMLPFAGADGRPVVEIVAPGPRHEAMLPFVDEAGLPIVAPIQPRSDGMVMLPFVDERGQPLLVPAAPAVAPGGGPSPAPRVGPGGPGR